MGGFRAKYSQKAITAKRNGKKPKLITHLLSNSDNNNGVDEEEINQDQGDLEEAPDTPGSPSQPPRPKSTPPPPLSTLDIWVTPQPPPTERKAVVTPVITHFPNGGGGLQSQLLTLPPNPP